ncbi:hypothetical protein T484DRAFT_1939721 [Baffinella frigidus]|nr:hypothetical protein T484DRAFT_1939721 [Cryptophyta sp. CCMP2293]
MRLSVLPGVAAGLALFNAAEAFAPTGGVWLQTPARASLCPRIDSAIHSAPPSRNGGVLTGPTMLLEDSPSSPIKRTKHHKNPTLGFRPSFCVRKTGKHLFHEEEVRKEVLENTVDTFVTKFDHSFYKIISQSSHAFANNMPSMKNLLKSLPPLHVPAGADFFAHKMLHTVMHTGHAALVPALFLLQSVVLFYAAVLHKGSAHADGVHTHGTGCLTECEEDTPLCLPGEEGPQCCCAC